jgi:hypothetical protein
MPVLDTSTHYNFVGRSQLVVVVASKTRILSFYGLINDYPFFDVAQSHLRLERNDNPNSNELIFPIASYQLVEEQIYLNVLFLVLLHLFDFS